MFRAYKPLILLAMAVTMLLLGGCSNAAVLDPKGPVAEQQKDLILLSIGFMLFIVGVVFVLFTIILVKYRERKNSKSKYDPDNEGNTFLEVVWTVIPIIIVTALAIPTVRTIYSLEEAPKVSENEEPLVVYATSVDWKWIFSYPEQEIETVNYLNIPTDRPILFKLTSADSMNSLWIPQLGGQEYAMAGMEMEQYLQADEEGTYKGRNANFNGDGFAEQKFNVNAMEENDFNEWVSQTQGDAPKLTEDMYNYLMLPEHVGEQEYSSTHLGFVSHGEDAEYALGAREKLGFKPTLPHSKAHTEQPSFYDKYEDPKEK
ncbi:MULTISPECIES: cytochrome aa3 quinol oxidase subunit II [Bacillus]|uniref:Quinol oxidase subunit 2 n=2 Tax=Bacillus TaxID=1386 RepID=A0A0M3RAA1_9BACI|nr:MULTISPECIES: cytochrome aa3 quinol oxidase subunit II [Bacillus]ALC82816.1 quinol oxidase subunit 2 [Bacillus gobiensis]MBP1081778.1 cytochrome aa3-600 menaquinol oxidase subunit 2 [Bacillus capparidis]MED1096429.1 cytochrome aa3 quinol oxidase subunit II [Bacillus capparidis]